MYDINDHMSKVLVRNHHVLELYLNLATRFLFATGFNIQLNRVLLIPENIERNSLHQCPTLSNFDDKNNLFAVRDRRNKSKTAKTQI